MEFDSCFENSLFTPRASCQNWGGSQALSFLGPSVASLPGDLCGLLQPQLAGRVEAALEQLRASLQSGKRVEFDKMEKMVRKGGYRSSQNLGPATTQNLVVKFDGEICGCF